MSKDTDDSIFDDARGYSNWPHDLNALQNIGEEIINEWREQEPQSPRDFPPVQWLGSNGYSHLKWILREKHDIGVPEFFILFTSAGGSTEYEWGIEDLATIEMLRIYLDEQVQTRKWSGSTKRTNRSRISDVLYRFSILFGDDAIISLANDPSLKTEVYDTFKKCIIEVRSDSASDDSAYKSLRSTHRFFEWLGRSNRIEYDPMEGIEEEFRWKLHTEPEVLTDNQVKRLWIAAETDEERMLVIGYCVWGLRTKELPAVHVDQINLCGRDPTIEFSKRDRKNGQGSVSLLFGIDALTAMLDSHAQDPTWEGYLYVSPEKDRLYLCPKQMRRKFKALCEKAGVTVNGEVPTPKYGRSWYYNTLAKAETDLLDAAGKLAELQGASDPASVRDAYFTEETRRRYRRIFFRHRVLQVLPDTAYIGSRTQSGRDKNISEFE